MSLMLHWMRRALRRAWPSVLVAVAVSAGIGLHGTVSAALVDRAETVLGEARLGGYDILVRPVGSRTALEEVEGLVAPDHLSGISGGIPFAAYEAIREVPGVEVAAPIAVLGYQRLHFWISTTLWAEGTYEVRCVCEVDDGEWQDAKESAATVAMSPQDLAVTRETEPMTQEPLPGPSVGCLFTYWGLVAAVDPAAEDALAGLRGAVRGRYLPADREPGPDVGSSRRGAWPDGRVPVLLTLSDPASVDLYGEARRLDAREGRAGSGVLPFGGGSDLADRLYTAYALEWSDEWLPAMRPQYARAQSPTDTSTDMALEVVLPPRWSSFPWEAPVAASTTTRPGPSIGTGNPGITWAPVGTVWAEIGDTMPTGVTVYAENYRTPSDHLPGSAAAPYLSSPLTLLTTLDAARVLGGEDAISAVRVRVAGVERLSRQALVRIDAVAREIAERTGLEVDVVAGSATRDVLVRLPDRGYVEQTWIQRGVGQALLLEATEAEAWLWWPMGVLVAGLMLGVALVPRQRGASDYAILAHLGWPRWAIIALAVGAGLLVGVLGAGVGLLAGAALAVHLGWQPLWAPGAGLLLVGGLVGAVGQLRAVPAGEHASEGSGAPRDGPAEPRRGPAEPRRGPAEPRRGVRLPTGGVAAMYAAMVALAFGVVEPLEALCAETPLGEAVADRVAPLLRVALGLAVGLAVVGVIEALAREGASSQAGSPALLVRLGWRRTRALARVGRTGLRMLVAGTAGGLAGTLLAGLLCGAADPRLTAVGAGAVAGGVALALLGEWVGLGWMAERAALPGSDDGGGER